MNYAEARNKAFRTTFLGVALLLLCGTVTLLGLLKFSYTGFDASLTLFPNLAPQIKRGVYAIYQNTQYLSLVWELAPSLTVRDLSSLVNAHFLAWYLGMFYGVSLLRAAKRQFGRLRDISKQIDEEIIRASIRGSARVSRVQIEESLPIPQQPKWTLRDFRTEFISPLVVGVILLMLGKVLGLS